jgi:16S rRNA (uracil1498-N3)-methyltransferase
VRRFTIAPERIRDGRVVFDRDESRHLARVLRLRSGDTVVAADGAGHEYTVRLETVGKETTGTVLAAAGDNQRESPVRITLFQAVPKGDKMETIVRACTELGVARIVPVLTERTIVTLDAGRWRDRARRWQRIAKEAAKQCGRAVVPPVDVPRAIDDVLAGGDDPDLRLCLWEGARDSGSEQPPGQALVASLPLTLPGGAGVALLVGPEGGFASSEVVRARAHGWLIVGAGPRILRTETAGPAIIAVLQARFGDLGDQR